MTQAQGLGGSAVLLGEKDWCDLAEGRTQGHEGGSPAP